MYRELVLLKTFEERYDFLKTLAARQVGEQTFGSMRFLNQAFYNGRMWKQTRARVIVRDGACDLGMEDRPIHDSKQIRVHHIQPISIEFLEEESPLLYDENNLITMDYVTHQLLTFGAEAPRREQLIERKPYDHAPWRG